VVLVTGQVESDAALRFGASRVRTNLALLQAVRREHPQAYIVYKPHPDVVARLRRAASDRRALRARDYDLALPHADLAQLLTQVDEVHVMTSLAGFEALLRGRRVTCHGQPFYAGWGLTIDRCPSARRRRCLSLDQLVAGALILYPTYISRRSGAITAVEDAIEELLEWRGRAAAGVPWWRRVKRSVLRRVVGVS